MYVEMPRPHSSILPNMLLAHMDVHWLRECEMLLEWLSDD